MTRDIITLRTSFAVRPKARDTGIILTVVLTVQEWAERRRQRLALREMPDHMLRDIGLSRADAYRESVKPFWHD